MTSVDTVFLGSRSSSHLLYHDTWHVFYTGSVSPRRCDRRMSPDDDVRMELCRGLYMLTNFHHHHHHHHSSFLQVEDHIPLLGLLVDDPTPHGMTDLDTHAI